MESSIRIPDFLKLSKNTEHRIRVCRKGYKTERKFLLQQRIPFLIPGPFHCTQYSEKEKTEGRFPPPCYMRALCASMLQDTVTMSRRKTAPNTALALPTHTRRKPHSS